MQGAIKGLRRLAGGGLLLLEVRGMRRELAELRAVGERIAAALEAYNAHAWPQMVQPISEVPAVEVEYVTNQQQAEFMEIESRLTLAKGLPPTEDEIIAEYNRLHDLDAFSDPAPR